MKTYCVYETDMADPMRLSLLLEEASELVWDMDSLRNMLGEAALEVARLGERLTEMDPDVYNVCFAYCESRMRSLYTSDEYPTAIFEVDESNEPKNLPGHELKFVPLGIDLWAIKNGSRYEGVAMLLNDEWPDRKIYPIDAYIEL